MEHNYLKISDIGKVITGKTPSTEDANNFDGKYPFITPSDIRTYSEKYLLNTERTLSDLGAETLKGNKLPENTICFVCIGSTIGKMCMTNCESFTNQQINSIIPFPEYDSSFIFYILRYVKSYFQSIGGGTGSGKGIVNKTVFSKTKLDIPFDLETQRRIAEILSAYDSLIELNTKRIKALEQMAENLYKEWFVRFRFPGHENAEFENGIPKGWEVKRIGEIGDVVGGGTPSTDHAEYWDGDIPWLTPADMKSFDDIYISFGNTFITEEGLKKSSATMLPKDTVLLSSRAPIGYVGIAKNPICTNQGFKSVICNSAVMQPFILFYFFKKNKDLLECYASGSTFLELSSGRLKKIKVLVPPPDIQNYFVDIVTPWIKQTDSLSEINSNLIKQRDLLLPRLMSGKLEV